MSDTIRVQVDYPFWVAYLGNLAMIRFLPLSLVAIFLAPAFVLYLLGPRIVATGAIGFGEVFVILLSIAMFPIILLLALWLGRQRNAFARGPFTFNFSEEGMQVEGEAVSSMTKWPAVLRVVETASYLFFFVGTRRAQMLPLASVPEETRARIRALVAPHVKGKNRWQRAP